MHRWILTLVVWMGWAACGSRSSTQPTESPQPAASAGAESAIEDAPDADEPAAAAAPAGAPATLKVITKVGGQPVAAHVKVFDSSGALLAEGASGAPLAVRSGDLELEAELSDSKKLHGHELVRRSVSLEAGADATETLIFERCMVRVVVRIRGKVDPTAVVTLMKDGATVVKLQSGDHGYVAVAPGRYNANVRSQRAAITSSDITLNEGATQTVPIDVN